ncbi:TIGR01459 family HAD-type hydrolase [Micromonospora chersina]|uniref:TIGR01459 family HAD-type hydrolase n=1 Tax=Micromonospora chersina TaxID=47854 RepID=UPI003713C1CC
MTDFPTHVWAPPRPGSADQVVLAFGPAGSGPTWWGGLLEQLPAGVELWVPVLPGRWNRSEETPYQEMDVAAAALAADLGPWLAGETRPVSLLGICGGAALALELVTRLDDRQRRCLRGVELFKLPALTAADHAELYRLPTPQFRAGLRVQGMVTDEVAADDELFAFFEPLLRADIALVERYTPTSLRLAGVPVTVHGEDDPDVLGQWAPLGLTVNRVRPFGPDEFPHPTHSASFVPALLDSLAERPNGPVGADSVGPGDDAQREERDVTDPSTGTVILRVVRRLLDRPDLGVDHNLIDQGMTSIMAARFVVALRREQVELAVGDIFEYPTVEQLAKLADRPRSSGSHHAEGVLVPLADTGEGPVLYCVHGGNGQVGFMRPLFEGYVRDTGGSAVGIQAVGLDGSVPALTTVPEMAARYLAEITASGAASPVLLAGYCAGGEIAVEMAAQLRAEGRPATFVGILDPFVPDHEMMRADDATLLRFRVEELVGHCVTAGRRRETVDPLIVGTDEPLARALAGIGRLSPDGGVAELRGQLSVWLGVLRAVHAYRRPETDVVTDVFRAVPQADAEDRRIRAGEHLFAGSHDYIFESPELVSVLGAAVRNRRAGSIPETLPGFGPLVDRYDAFVLDQWGVLHEGNQLYPGVLPFIEELRQRGKEIVILTNSSKSATRNRDRLRTRFGLPPTAYDSLVSSADLIRQYLDGELTLAGLPAQPPRRVFVIADEGDEQLLDGCDVVSVADIDAAEAVVVLSVPAGSTVAEHRDWLEHAARRRLPLLCPSCDLHTVRPDGVYLGMAELLLRYRELGGPLHNLGKPHHHVYDVCRRALSTTDPARILAVGDQIASDVAGARAQGWATALVLTGAGTAALEAGGAPHPDHVVRTLTW